MGGQPHNTFLLNVCCCSYVLALDVFSNIRVILASGQSVTGPAHLHRQCLLRCCRSGRWRLRMGASLVDRVYMREHAREKKKKKKKKKKKNN